MKNFNLIKIFKVGFFLLLLAGFFLLVDLKDLSFKSIIPEAQERTKINKGDQSGIIRNTKEESYNSIRSFSGTEEDIVDLVNLAREDAGLERLTENDDLKISALDKAQHMKDNDYFDHVSPGGLQPWFFAQKNNYDYKSFGENLAEGYFSADSVHEGWMNSEGHRENILSENFKEIGVAILEFEQNSQKSYLLVQHFGSQLTQEDLITKVICEEDSKENCEEAEEREDYLDDLIEEQEDIIKKAKEQEVNKKEINRLEENLEELEEADNELEDYLDECKKFLKKCDEFE
jgi:uncharacterized protein YkwD